jgi:hypothetical protein
VRCKACSTNIRVPEVKATEKNAGKESGKGTKAA